jgi:hypothetical protein
MSNLTTADFGGWEHFCFSLATLPGTGSAHREQSTLELLQELLAIPGTLGLCLRLIATLEQLSWWPLGDVEC